MSKANNTLHMEKLIVSYPGFLGGTEYIYRAKIPGGWIVLIKADEATPGFFIPDPQHIWDGSSLP